MLLKKLLKDLEKVRMCEFIATDKFRMSILRMHLMA
jgi:hypothetical protein